MVGISGADETIEREIECFTQFYKFVRVMIHVFLARLPFFVSLLGNFLSVLVSAGVEKNLMA